MSEGYLLSRRATIGIPLMAVAFALVLMIPELPLRRSVREPMPA